MEKEELKLLRDWCVGTAAIINILADTKQKVPESVDLITERPADKKVHVFSGIEKIAAALKEPMHFEFGSTIFEKTVSYNGVTFFQVGFYSKKGEKTNEQ